MPAEFPDDIPGVEDKQLAAVAGLLPALPNHRAEPADRFAQAVRTLVESRARRDWPSEGESDLAVFVMVDHPRRIGERHGALPFADPLAKNDPLLGRLFFANRDASAGWFMSIPTDPNAILEWLADHDLGGCPIVTVYRTSKKMFTRRAGINDPARHDPIRDREPSATLPELMEALAHFHRTRLLTPMCRRDGVWEPGCADRYVPGPQPERSIQSTLGVALASWFRGVVRAEAEDDTSIGRIDIRLLRKSEDGSLAYWVIMELKVVKSFRNAPRGSNPSPVSESDNVAAIVEGVRQAGSYRENRSAEEGLLEIYDLRKDKTNDLTKHDKVLDAMNRFAPRPEVHVWPVFGSARDARIAGFTGV